MYGQRDVRDTTDLGVEQGLSELHASVVAALAGWTPAIDGLGEVSEQGAEFRLYDTDESAKPAGEFLARFSMLAIVPCGSPYLHPLTPRLAAQPERPRPHEYQPRAHEVRRRRGQDRDDARGRLHRRHPGGVGLDRLGDGGAVRPHHHRTARTHRLARQGRRPWSAASSRGCDSPDSWSSLCSDWIISSRSPRRRTGKALRCRWRT